MRSVIALALLGLLWIGIAVSNMMLGNGRLLPGWILVGVVFLAVAGGIYAVGGDADPDSVEA